MAVKPLVTQIPIRILTKWQQSHKIMQNITIHSSRVFPRDIIDIDTVEVAAARPLLSYTKIDNYKFSSAHPINEKGTFIDMWI